MKPYIYISPNVASTIKLEVEMDMLMIRNRKFVLHALCFVLIIFGVSADDTHRSLSQEKPERSNAPAFARWLVSENSWGVLSTIADDIAGAPFGDVVSYSDGEPYHGTGIPYFYLTTLDPTTRYALKDHRSSFTISEYPLGSCGQIDPENPTCSKITLTGKLNEVDADSEESGIAKKALFSKHAEMKNWPKDHTFKVYWLDIEEIFLIDFSSDPKPLTVDQYFLPGKEGRWE
ncbi:putative FMN-binding split barrel [Helianthus annuus]|nr:putative FMN-binding split barrel [Helianthus annuus]